MNGKLYLCATPIGNLGDVSARCLEAFNNADLIAAEDTRRTLQLLNHFEISKPLTSYHEHNKHEKGEYIISLLKNGKNIVLVSDAIPGPVAGINALILSGLPTRRFAFEGFLSVNKRHRKEHLELVKNDTHTLIFYEAPHKLKNTLSDMQKTFGGDRKIALVRELTKIHEEVKRCTIDEAIAYYSENNPRGEYVLVVEGAKEVEETEENEWENISIKEHVDKYIAEGMTSKDAIKKAAADRNLPKRDVYNEYHRGE